MAGMRERTQKIRARALETQGVALGTQGVVGTERPSGSAFIAIHSLQEPSMSLASSSPVVPTTDNDHWPLPKSRRFTPVYGCWKDAKKRHFAPHFEPVIGHATRCESFHMLNLDHGFGYWLHPLRELKTLVALLRRKRHNEMTVLFTIRSCPRSGGAGRAERRVEGGNQDGARSAEGFCSKWTNTTFIAQTDRGVCRSSR